MDVRFSITVRQHASLRDLIEAIPEEDWTPIPYWMDGAADVAATYTPFQTKPDAAPEAAHCRRVKPARFPGLPPSSPDTAYRLLTDRRPWNSDHRRQPRTPFKYGVGLNHMPSGRFAANGAWLASP